MNFFKIITLILFINCLSILNLYSQSSKNTGNSNLKCIVIDAGHGGNDPGATYGKYYEKNITLAIALELGRLINERHPDVKVIYTRKTDIFVELHQRSQIANDANADLFLSIHVNSAKSSSARGVETFLIGTNQSSKNMEIAMKENNVITLEDNYEQKYEGFDPNSAESYIIFSLMQSSFIEQSSIFASAIQEEYSKKYLSTNRGVKQAGFLVLWRTSMPSVLTEVGFLSNSTDRTYLINKEKQKSIALSLLNAFTRYKKEVDSGIKEISVSLNNESDQDYVELPITEPKPVTTKSSSKITDPKSVHYRVQLSSTSKEIDISYKNFGKFYKNVLCSKVNGSYKYYIKEKTYKEALKMQRTVRSDKFKDAFVTAYNGDVKINVRDAIAVTE
ncbi:MAG: N-acetylmuramoyl-L-alanine amidase [Rikenellaceae bacterium]